MTRRCNDKHRQSLGSDGVETVCGLNNIPMVGAEGLEPPTLSV